MELPDPPETPALRRARRIAFWTGLAAVLVAVVAWLLDVPIW